MSKAVSQFVILPSRGLKGTGTSSPAQRAFLLEAEASRQSGSALAIAPPPAMIANLLAFSAVSGLASVSSGLDRLRARPQSLRVLDSIHEDGAKLVELSPEAAGALRETQPGLRIVPVTNYELARAPRQSVVQSSVSASASLDSSGPSNSTTVTLEVVDAATGAPVPGALVAAFTDFASAIGAEGLTDAAGSCQLSLASNVTVIERLYVYPVATYWGALRSAIPVAANLSVRLQPVSLAHPDALQHYFPGSNGSSAGKGVKVGIVDSGIDLAHPGLRVVGGENTVPGEQPTDYGDNGQGHGTHVAGIIASSTLRGAEALGLAPQASLFSYRAFGANQKSATNYSLAKAIDRAIADGCDIINLSFADPNRDEVLAQAIDDAYQAGVLIVAAAGNNGRQQVGFPAALTAVAAVSALGRKGTFPVETVDEAEVADPLGTDPEEFIARFSNCGDAIDLTAPGVGIVSTFPGGKYGVMSGTSMAAPAITGYAARLLGAHPTILGMPRDANRADAALQVLLAAATPRGFGANFEGRGLPK